MNEIPQINRIGVATWVFVVLIALSPFAQAEDKLPLQTQNLLQKLSEWEDGEKASLEKLIQQKRDEVAQLLKQHLRKATQAGDLKTANLIQSEIDKLTLSPAASHEEEKSKTRSDREIKLIIMGEWKSNEEKSAFGSIQFTDNNELIVKTRDGKKYTLQWRINRHVLQFDRWGDGVWSDIEISKDGDELTLFYLDAQGERDAAVKYRK